jgi:LytS/YehU family sensor histidine kinase
MRDTPGLGNVEVNRVSGQLRAKFGRQDLIGARGRFQEVLYCLDIKQSQVLAILSPREGATSIKLICEPAGGLLAELFMFDGGSNAVTTDAIARRLAADIGAIRRDERAATVAAATQKEVAEARLSVLEAQVEPHFLYNTLGSAKYLIKSDPVRAEAMLDNLIVYLRKSLPKTDESTSTLGEELHRARAYLEIMQIRMGERLALNIDVPNEFAPHPFPNMMLQTLVENGIKHGLEPKSAGGSIWIRARREETARGPLLLVTVADDGLGMNHTQSGTGIGHRNIRERLRLLYDGAADFSLSTNFPTGLAATIRVPILPAPGATL